eukprot:3941364-Rhodomonas_salina.1
MSSSSDHSPRGDTGGQRSRSASPRRTDAPPASEEEKRARPGGDARTDTPQYRRVNFSLLAGTSTEFRPGAGSHDTPGLEEFPFLAPAPEESGTAERTPILPLHPTAGPPPTPPSSDMDTAGGDQPAPPSSTPPTAAMEAEDIPFDIAESTLFHKLLSTGKLTWDWEMRPDSDFTGSLGTHVENYKTKHGNIDDIHASFSLTKSGALTNTPESYKTWLLQHANWLSRAKPSDAFGYETLMALNGRGTKAYRKRLLAIEAAADTGSDDPTLTTGEAKAAFISKRDTMVAELNQEAGKEGWPVLSAAEDAKLMARIGDILQAVAAHTPHPAPLALRNRTLSLAEHIAGPMADADTSDMEKEARIYELATAIYRIQCIDIYATMELHESALNKRVADWDPSGLFIDSWTGPDRTDSANWADAVDGVTAPPETIDQDYIPEYEAYGVRLDARDTELARRKFDLITRALGLGYTFDQIVHTPLLDPRRPPPPTMDEDKASIKSRIIRVLNPDFPGRSKIDGTTAAKLFQYRLPPTQANCRLPPRGTWIPVTIHGCHIDLWIGDPQRHGTPAKNRERAVDTHDTRGVTIRDVVVLTPSTKGNLPDHIDFTADLLVDNEGHAEEYYDGRRIIMMGSAANGTLTRVCFTYTPPDAYWLLLQGLHLNDTLAGCHAANGHTFDYFGCMLFIQTAIISSGFAHVGPVRAHSRRQVDGRQDPAPFTGPDAKYEALVYTLPEAMAIAHPAAEERKIKLIGDTAASFLTARFKTAAHFESRKNILTEGEKAFQEPKLPTVSVQPTGVASDELVKLIKVAFGIPTYETILQHRMQERIAAKILRDLPWAAGALLKVVVEVIDKTGQWNKEWIMLLFKDWLHQQAFIQICTATEVETSPDGNPFRIELLPDGVTVKTYMRYDLFLGDNEASTASSFMWVARGDAREKNFTPGPRPDPSAWQLQAHKPITASSPAETLVPGVQWIETPLPPSFAYASPDPLPVIPSNHPLHRLTRSEIFNFARILKLLLPSLKSMVWFPGWTYETILSDIMWLRLSPALHEDGRKKIISCPDVKTILDSPQKFYASLIYLRAEGFVKVDNKDMGFVITREGNFETGELAPNGSVVRRPSTTSSSGSSSTTTSQPRGPSTTSGGFGRGTMPRGGPGMRGRGGMRGGSSRSQFSITMGATNLPPRAQLQLLAPPPPAPGLLGPAPSPAADGPGGTF